MRAPAAYDHRAVPALVTLRVLAPPRLQRQHPALTDLTQVEGHHRSFEVDILYECWAKADRLSLHSVAAHCEWALAKMWGERRVYARTSELSPGAVLRIARSLSVGLDASHQGLLEVVSLPLPGVYKGPSEIKKKLREVTQASNYLTETATAAAMAQWRISEAE